MSIVRINDRNVDTDFIDCEVCSICDEWYECSEGCDCEEK